MTLNDSEKIAWSAGLLEGEGSFGKINKYQFGITIDMTDLDVLEKLKEYMEISSKIYGPYIRKNYKPIYHLRINKQEEVIRIIDRIWKYLSYRRQQQILEGIIKCDPLRLPKSRQRYWDIFYFKWLES